MMAPLFKGHHTSAKGSLPVKHATVMLMSSDPNLIETIKGIIGSIGHLRLSVVPKVDAACAELDGGEVALIVNHLDDATETAGVTQMLRKIASIRRPIPVLLLGEQYDAKQVLTWLRLGAVDYLSHPWDMVRLAYLVDALTVRARYVGMASPVFPAKPVSPAVMETLGEQEPFLFWPDADMGRLMDQVRAVAPLETTVLLTGETGTGKTHLARIIHELSPRRNLPFQVVNCGALSSSLIESEMFGHVKGAFTGADRDRTGKFAEAGAGTLLLDEIDALPLALQAKLLRAVEERVFEQVGSNRSQPMRARVIAASNRALDLEVAAGRFRSDLYYRLNVVGFTMPPLRQRRSTIAPLANRYISKFSARIDRKVGGLNDAVLRALECYTWPGNIRELRNVIERAVALCPGPEIQLDDLPATVRSIPTVADSPQIVPQAAPEVLSTLAHATGQAELRQITEALLRNGNNRLRTAGELGISRMTLYNKLHKLGMMNVAQVAC
jgi:DNA-binding NtrC family response regulator